MCRGQGVGFLSGAWLNHMHGYTGFMLGGVNVVDDGFGLQMGLVNCARSLKGVQIGVINIISDSLFITALPVVNMSF